MWSTWMSKELIQSKYKYFYFSNDVKSFQSYNMKNFRSKKIITEDNSVQHEIIDANWFDENNFSMEQEIDARYAQNNSQDWLDSEVKKSNAKRKATERATDANRKRTKR